MNQKMLWMILVGLKVASIVLTFIALCIGMSTTFRSFAVTPAVCDSYSNGDLKIIAQIAYILSGILMLPLMPIAIFSVVAQLALKNLYESKKKLFMILHVVIAVIVLIAMLMYPFGLIIACDTTGPSVPTPVMVAYAKGDYQVSDLTCHRHASRVFGATGWGVSIERDAICKAAWQMTGVIMFFLCGLLVVAVSGATAFLTIKVKPAEAGGLMPTNPPPPEYDSQNAAGAPENEPISTSGSAPEYDAQA